MRVLKDHACAQRLSKLSRPLPQKIHEWLRELKEGGVLDAVSATTTSALRAAVGPRCAPLNSMRTTGGMPGICGSALCI